MIGTTWSTTDNASGAGYNTPILSGGNLTCELTTSNNNSTVVASVDGQTTGKFYVEFTPTAGASRAIAVGIIEDSQSRLLGSGSLNTTGCAVLENNGPISVNNSNVGSIAAMVNGTVNAMALDLGGELIWFRAGAAGDWNNSGAANPATGVGGIPIAALGGGLMKLILWECSFSSPPVTLTLNAGHTAFSGTVPAGFTAGWPGVGDISSTGLWFHH